MSKRDAQSLQQAFSLHRSGNFAEAAKLYRKIIRRDPRESHALHSLGIIEAADGNHAEAARLMARSLQVQPNNIQFVQNYATVLCQLGQFETAAAVGLKGLEADRNNVYLLYAVAGAWLKQNRLQDALVKFDELLLHEPNHIAGINERSSVLLALKQYDAALAGIEKAIALDPQYAEAHLNRGVAYAQLKRHDEAIAAFDRALRLNPNLANAWLGYGNALFELKQWEQALTAYHKALSLMPDSAEAWLGRANVFFDLKRYEEALTAYDKALSLKPDLAEAWLGRGNTLFEFKRYDEALAAHDKSLAFQPDSAKACVGRGNIFADLKRYDEAFAAYDAARSIDPDLPALEGERLHSRMHLCDWSDFEAEREHLVRSVGKGQENTSPFAFLAISSSFEDQFDCARSWTRKRCPATHRSSRLSEPYRHDRIRIGYLSSDFGQHPVASLVAGVIECHNRSRFEITGISIGPSDNSAIRRRLEGSFDTFMDAAALGADEIADQIARQEIDILIDLNGLTRNGRTEILARRPAPVQVNYLGYAGTMGAEYIDYIVADPILIPEPHRCHFSEKIVYLPHSYMPHDSKSRAISDRPIKRTEFGLPEDGFVFCCFNNAYKLNPVLFRARMELLKAVEGSVLWLSEPGAMAMDNLRREAIAAGIDPDRLVFAGRLPSSADHLARHRLADLFLDTLPYNAHATASDALWAGLPVLTQIGSAFAGRVAASLLTAIGLPELIVQTEKQFEIRAIELATEPAALAAIKDKLARNRLTMPLFDTDLYTRHLESAYATMLQRHRNGLFPDHIHVA